jgi:hypothetical protein
MPVLLHTLFVIVCASLSHDDQNVSNRVSESNGRFSTPATQSDLVTPDHQWMCSISPHHHDCSPSQTKINPLFLQEPRKLLLVFGFRVKEDRGDQVEKSFIVSSILLAIFACVYVLLS